MTDISTKFEDCEIVVRAGPSGESDDNIFRYVSSPLPDWVKSVDDPYYSRISQTALKVAKEIVEATGKNITLRYSVNIDK